MMLPFSLIGSGDGYSVHHSQWRGLSNLIELEHGKVDALIFDAPYSEKTHKGSDAADGNDGSERRKLNYEPWDDMDIRMFISAWSHICSGWIVSITDEILAQVWSARMRDAGRYVFPSIPYVAPGSRVRLTGDGPSCWTCWIVVSRPVELSRWRTTPGAYILPKGQSHDKPVMGGKEKWIMERLVEDYSNKGDLVCDPVCGAGTTGAASLSLGRRVILGDKNIDHCKIAEEWCRNYRLPPPGTKTTKPKTSQGNFW